MCVYHICTWCLWSPEEGVGSLELKLEKDVSCHVGAENPDPLKEQQMLLTAEPFLFPKCWVLSCATVPPSQYETL